MPQKPLDISTSLFYPRAEEQQASLPGEQPYDADAARIHKSVRVCSHMVHHKRLAESCKAFFATFKEGRRFCAFFLGIRDIGMMAGSARPLQINRKRHFGGDFRRGGGTPPYVLKGSLWGMSDIYRAKEGQRASGMSIKFQKFRDSSAKNSK